MATADCPTRLLCQQIFRPLVSFLCCICRSNCSEFFYLKHSSTLNMEEVVMAVPGDRGDMGEKRKAKKAAKRAKPPKKAAKKKASKKRRK